MKKSVALFFLFSVCTLGCATATASNDAGAPVPALQDGKASSKTIAFRYSYAYLHDNAEKVLERPRELRILLTDRPVARDAIAGLGTLPVEELARAGKVQGVLLRLDPDNMSAVAVSLLRPPASDIPVQTSQMIVAGTAFKKLQIGKSRVVGEISALPAPWPVNGENLTDFSTRFSTLLFSEPPVTADVTGKEALGSEQAELLRAKSRALAAGDFSALRRMSTARANHQLDTFLNKDDAETFARHNAAEIDRMIPDIHRLIVRGRHATLVFANREFAEFAYEEGRWKLN